jgi:site-specific recombinase XerD
LLSDFLSSIANLAGHCPPSSPATTDAHYRMDTYAKLSGIAKHITPHVFRHSTATQLIRMGNGIEVVGQILAHASLDTTRHYVHLVGDQVHAAVASLASPPHRRSSS